jgi:hypothetical protein
MTRYVWRVSPARRRSRTAIAESRANLREGHAYRTSADRRGRSAPHLLRLRNVCRRRRNLPKRARARLDQRHASVGQPPARAAGLERTALRSIGVVFILWPPRTAAGRKTAPHHRHHQTSPRRYERHGASGCAALCARRGREIEVPTRQRARPFFGYLRLWPALGAVFPASQRNKSQAQRWRPRQA